MEPIDLTTYRYLKEEKAWDEIEQKPALKPSLLESKDMITLANLETLPELNYIIPRLSIERGIFALLCAAGGSGKTMFLQYVAACISSGTPLFGTFPTAEGKVVHVDCEQSERLTVRRYIRLANGLGLTAVNIQRVTLASRLDDPKLKRDTVENELSELFSGATLAIIDSLKAATAADENSSDIEAPLKMLKRVAERTNCAIILVHHKGKTKTEARQSGRGHSSIYDSVDVQIDLDVVDKYSGIFELSCAKSRDGKYFDGLKYQLLDTGTFVASQNCTTCLELNLLEAAIKSSDDRRQKILLQFRADTTAAINQKNLFALVKGDRSGFLDTVDRLITDGLLAESRGQRNSRMFSLTEKGKTTSSYSQPGDA